ncbi:hypothetical protein CU663_21390, partial [Pseudomonas syringae pv. actinidifoliorum]|nr:hypothetical protein [Pseudomonas syringae pv. actinidifoliorum]
FFMAVRTPSPAHARHATAVVINDDY